MYRIGDFSKISKTTIKTLRYYDEAGLLKPSFVDKENGYRYYTTKQLIPLHKIISFRQIGLSIDEISLILSGKNEDYILQKRKSEIESQLQQITKQLSRINYILERKEEDYFMEYEAVIKEIPQYTVYYKEGIIPNTSSLEQFIRQALEEYNCVNSAIKYVQPDYCYITYLDPEFKTQNLKVAYVQAVTKEGKETETIKFKKIEPVTAVCTFHKGNYETINEAFSFIFQWIEKNGYTPVESPRERYIDGIWNNCKEKDWLTELQVPVAKK